MKRWIVPLILALLACGWVFSKRSTGQAQLSDTDTVALLAAIREKKDPLVWFRGDWPLQNHFYRPLPTLTFELDEALHPNDGTGFGVTSALIAVVCILMAFWMLAELTLSPLVTGAGTLVFAAWHTNPGALSWAVVPLWMLAVASLVGIIRGGKLKVGAAVSASLACVFLATQLTPVEIFSSRIVHWLPGRTASVMTLFAFLSLGSYARYVRLTSQRSLGVPSSTDVPATKSKSVLIPSKFGWIWVVVSAIGMLGALASYEQAVVLPALITGIWLFFRLTGSRSHIGPVIIFWALLVAFAVFRSQILPLEASGYQQQQFRSGPGVWISLGDYLLPGLFSTILSFQGATLLTILLVSPAPLVGLANLAGNALAWIKAWKDRESRYLFFALLLFAFGSFMPMAWLKPFGHYHYLSSAFRAASLVVLSTVVFKMVATAVSLPTTQAPRRLGLAPGSLLRQ